MKWRFWLSIACGLVFEAAPGYGKGMHTEDFTTTTYKDTANTTADWNTTAGALQLFPFAPSQVGNVSFAGQAQGIVVEGNLAFVAAGTGSFFVIDVSDPTNPTQIGYKGYGGYIYRVAVAGDLAFLTNGNLGLRIVDISNPTAPVHRGALSSPDALGIAVAGDLAFVADKVMGLRIIDISNPSVPTAVGLVQTPDVAWGVAVAGDLAFVADNPGGLQIIDVSNPASPAIVGSYNTPGAARTVAVAGDHAFVADGTAGLQIVDISNPVSPTLTGSYDTPGFALNVVVEGNLAYVSDNTAGLQVIDITDPANPTLAASIAPQTGALWVAVAGDLAYVADNTSGLQVVRVAHPTDPTQIGSYSTPGWAYNVAVSGDLAFLADTGSGLQILDISNPASPTPDGSYRSSGTAANDVKVDGDLAFVSISGDSMGLDVVDITDPAAPSLVGSYRRPNTIGAPYVAVDVAGDWVSLAGDSVFAMIDVSDPANPTLAGNYLMPGQCVDVTVAGDLALVTVLRGQLPGLLQIMDISNPASPTLTASYTTLDSPFRVTIAGNLAFVADGTSLLIIDITDPANPAQVSTYTMLYSAFLDVAIAGDFAIVAEAVSKLHVLDISDPANPSLTGSVSTTGTTNSVTVDGHFAFVCIVNAFDPGSVGLDVIQVFQNEADPTGDIGQSLTINAGDPMVRTRLSATETAGVTWEISGNAGASWQAMTSDNVWNQLATPGAELQWRSTHVWAGTNPSVSDVQIEWLFDYATIDAITDVPNDQGRQVSVEWSRSGHDFVGDASQIVEYGVYRKIDPNLSLVQAQLTAQISEGLRPTVRQHALMMQAAGWHFLLTVPVRVEDSYAVVVPTLADSTIASGDYQSTFMVTAFTATPGVYFDSPPDSGYSVDNLAPGAPMNLVIDYNTGGGNTLSWDESVDTDFQYFSVYRSLDPNFVPSTGTLVHSTATTNWVDPDYDGWGIYYKITATDFSGNESDPASPGSATGVENVIPDRFALYQNVPNPFNPSTAIAYDVPPGGGSVTIRIYGVTGRLVREFIDDTVIPGHRRWVWSGKNEEGRNVSSGIYFYRLSATGFTRTRKMLLLK